MISENNILNNNEEVNHFHLTTQRLKTILDDIKLDQERGYQGGLIDNALIKECFKAYLGINWDGSYSKDEFMEECQSEEVKEYLADHNPDFIVTKVDPNDFRLSIDDIDIIDFTHTRTTEVIKYKLEKYKDAKNCYIVNSFNINPDPSNKYEFGFHNYMNEIGIIYERGIVKESLVFNTKGSYVDTDYKQQYIFEDKFEDEKYIPLESMKDIIMRFIDNPENMKLYKQVSRANTSNFDKDFTFPISDTRKIEKIRKKYGINNKGNDKIKHGMPLVFGKPIPDMAMCYQIEGFAELFSGIYNLYNEHDKNMECLKAMKNRHKEYLKMMVLEKRVNAEKETRIDLQSDDLKKFREELRNDFNDMRERFGLKAKLSIYGSYDKDCLNKEIINNSKINQFDKYARDNNCSYSEAKKRIKKDKQLKKKNDPDYDYVFAEPETKLLNEYIDYMFSEGEMSYEQDFPYEESHDINYEPLLKNDLFNTKLYNLSKQHSEIARHMSHANITGEKRSSVTFNEIDKGLFLIGLGPKSYNHNSSKCYSLFITRIMTPEEYKLMYHWSDFQYINYKIEGPNKYAVVALTKWRREKPSTLARWRDAHSMYINMCSNLFETFNDKEILKRTLFTQYFSYIENKFPMNKMLDEISKLTPMFKAFGGNPQKIINSIFSTKQRNMMGNILKSYLSFILTEYKKKQDLFVNEAKRINFFNTFVKVGDEDATSREQHKFKNLKTILEYQDKKDALTDEGREAGRKRTFQNDLDYHLDVIKRELQNDEVIIMHNPSLCYHGAKATIRRMRKNINSNIHRTHIAEGLLNENYTSLGNNKASLDHEGDKSKLNTALQLLQLKTLTQKVGEICKIIYNRENFDEVRKNRKAFNKELKNLVDDLKKNQIYDENLNSILEMYRYEYVTYFADKHQIGSFREFYVVNVIYKIIEWVWNTFFKVLIQGDETDFINEPHKDLKFMNMVNMIRKEFKDLSMEELILVFDTEDASKWAPSAEVEEYIPIIQALYDEGIITRSIYNLFRFLMRKKCEKVLLLPNEANFERNLTNSMSVHSKVTKADKEGNINLIGEKIVTPKSYCEKHDVLKLSVSWLQGQFQDPSTFKHMNCVDLANELYPIRKMIYGLHSDDKFKAKILERHEVDRHSFFCYVIDRLLGVKKNLKKSFSDFGRNARAEYLSTYTVGGNIVVPIGKNILANKNNNEYVSFENDFVQQHLSVMNIFSKGAHPYQCFLYRHASNINLSVKWHDKLFYEEKELGPYGAFNKIDYRAIVAYGVEGLLYQYKDLEIFKKALFLNSKLTNQLSLSHAGTGYFSYIPLSRSCWNSTTSHSKTLKRLKLSESIAKVKFNNYLDELIKHENFKPLNILTDIVSFNYKLTNPSFKSSILGSKSLYNFQLFNKFKHVPQYKIGEEHGYYTKDEVIEIIKKQKGSVEYVDVIGLNMFENIHLIINKANEEFIAHKYVNNNRLLRGYQFSNLSDYTLSKREKHLFIQAIQKVLNRHNYEDMNNDELITETMVEINKVTLRNTELIRTLMIHNFVLETYKLKGILQIVDRITGKYKTSLNYSILPRSKDIKNYRRLDHYLTKQKYTVTHQLPNEEFTDIDYKVMMTLEFNSFEKLTENNLLQNYMIQKGLYLDREIDYYFKAFYFKVLYRGADAIDILCKIRKTWPMETTDFDLESKELNITRGKDDNYSYKLYGNSAGYFMLEQYKENRKSSTEYILYLITDDRRIIKMDRMGERLTGFKQHIEAINTLYKNVYDYMNKYTSPKFFKLEEEDKERVYIRKTDNNYMKVGKSGRPIKIINYVQLRVYKTIHTTFEYDKAESCINIIKGGKYNNKINLKPALRQMSEILDDLKNGRLNSSYRRLKEYYDLSDIQVMDVPTLEECLKPHDLTKSQMLYILANSHYLEMKGYGWLNEKIEEVYNKYYNVVEQQVTMEETETNDATTETITAGEVEVPPDDWQEGMLWGDVVDDENDLF